MQNNTSVSGDTAGNPSSPRWARGTYCSINSLIPAQPPIRKSVLVWTVCTLPTPPFSTQAEGYKGNPPPPTGMEFRRNDTASDVSCSRAVPGAGHQPIEEEVVTDLGTYARHRCMCCSRKLTKTPGNAWRGTKQSTWVKRCYLKSTNLEESC